MAEQRTPGDRLKFFRENEAKLSQRLFAARLGYTGGLIGQIETGKTSVSRELLDKLSDNYRLNSAWLLDGRDPMIFESLAGFPSRQGKEIAPPDYDRPGHGDLKFEGKDYAFVRRMDLSVSAGSGLMPVRNGDAESVALPILWFSRQGINSDLVVLVSVSGDSMMPSIPDGALVLLNVGEKSPTKTGVYAFNLDGQSYVKRIVPSGTAKDGRPLAILLVSDNPAYAPIALSGEGMNTLKVVGRVRAVLTSL